MAPRAESLGIGPQKSKGPNPKPDAKNALTQDKDKSAGLKTNHPPPPPATSEPKKSPTATRFSAAKNHILQDFRCYRSGKRLLFTSC
ncbi:hypothetical protein N7491_001451 [Penicillium cf. griseofulvum]|uniref:Uncharacterized protein n=1 Tax=Penicillium cf. griseofulvum TaxID=2972120 RepID=A0A9W9JGV7_9EURO|nr:hypothetical protein N7472_006582 [Penicillium cf. griseofulvum]KAJ5445369.1 hypothetical protein N7491_001451 [Penicillium cf. griseofulvum]KAJ5447088.1 hypothetical protein N7445_001909 [Penicillium cf. griseofulvum]